MSLSRRCIERPKATILLVAGCLGLGVLAYFQLPVSALPDIEFPTINVSTSLPGADAETMASAVASPLERSLAHVNGLTAISSSSMLGRTNITLQFNLNRNIDAAAEDVQAAINAASGLLPQDLPNPPTYIKIDPNGISILNLAATSETAPLTQVYESLEDIVLPTLSLVPGVGVVDFHGDQIPAVRVRLNPAALAARGLDLESVRSALALATVDRPKGTLDGTRRQLVVRANDQLLNAAHFNEQIIAWRGGAPVRIRDVGRAVDAAQETNIAAWSNKQPAIIVDIHKQLGANLTSTVDQIKKQLPEIVRALPPGVRLEVVGDHTQTTRASIRDVQVTLGITIGLVAFVIFLFLRTVSATLIPGISIPLCLIGTFPFMLGMGHNLDTISLMGLTIAVGFVVDDAIVVTENIVRHLEMGKTARQAAIDGAGEVSFTVVSMTLSLVAVFLPLLLMGGIVGRLFREFALAVSTAVVLSAIVSLTQTAVASSLLLKPPAETGHGWFLRFFERAFSRMNSWYRSGLVWVLGRRREALAATIGMLIASVVLFIVIPKGFMPEQDSGLIAVTTEAAPGIPFPEMCRKELAVAAILRADPAVAQVFSFVEPQPSLNNGRATISLKAFSQRSVTAADVIARLRIAVARVPGVRVYFRAVQDIQVGTRGGKTLYQYALQDNDPQELYRWVPIFHEHMRALPELLDVASDLDAPQPALTVTVDRDKAASYAITADAVDQALYDAFGQRPVATVFTPSNQHKVVLEVQPNWHLDEESLRSIYILSPRTGQPVPLAAVARLTSSLSPTTVNHLSSIPATTFSFNLAPGVSLGQAVDAIGRMERAIGKPPTVLTSFQGTAQAFQQSLASQPYLILGAILVVYIILGVLYESFMHPITILSSLPSATFGALCTMLLFRYDLSVITLIGLILLVGIVKKNAIMMVDVALTLQRKQGMEPQKAIFEAALLRFRPIMMTTMAALFGAIPLALSAGAGSEFRRPLGVALVGGLLVSQFVTLYTVPVIYLYMDRLISWSGPWRKARRQAPSLAAAPS